MPRIPIYEPNTFVDTESGITPRATSADFGSGAGLEAIGQGFSTVSDTLNRVAEQQEVTNAAVAAAQFRAQWTSELTKRANSDAIGNPNFSDDFHQEMMDSTNAADGQFYTAAGQRAWAQQKAEAVSALSERASMHQAAAQRGIAIQKWNSFLDNQRNSLVQDPTQFNSVMRQSLDLIHDPSGPLADTPPQDRLAVERETKSRLAQSTVEGMFRIDPQAASDALKRGDYAQFLDKDATFMLENRADRFIRAQEVDQMRRIALQDKLQREAEKNDENKFVTALYTDPTALKPNDILNSNLSPEHKVQFLNMQAAAVSPQKIATDPRVFQQVFDRIHLPDGDPRKITDENELNPLVGHGLDMEGLKTLRGEMEGKGTQDGELSAQLRKNFFEMGKHELTGSDPIIGLRDPKGDVIYQRWLASTLTAYQQQHAAGKTDAQLFNPDSPDYLGKTIGTLKRPLSEYFADLAGSNPAHPEFIEAAKAAPPPQPAADDQLDLSTPDKIREAFRAGKLPKDKALELLKSQGLQ